MVAPFLMIAALQNDDAKALLKALRTPAPFSIQDQQIRAQRERIVRNAQKSPRETFERVVARAEQSHALADVVLAIAVGIETVPRYVSWTSRDYTRLIKLVKKCDPKRSLEYRRSAYLMRAHEFLVVLDESPRSDPNGPIRRALLTAYPDDPQVWYATAGESMYVSRFVGDADARRIAKWWERWSPAKDPRFTARRALWARMACCLGIASWTKVPGDALQAESLYRSWAKAAPASEKDDVKFYGDAVKGVKGLAGLQ